MVGNNACQGNITPTWIIGLYLTPTSMGFHLNKVVLISINVELLTLKVCFIFQNYCWPLCCGERHLFVTFCNQQGVEGVYLNCSFFYFFIFISIIIFFKFFISLELFLLLPAADDFEKQCLLYFLLSDWPVAEISSQQLNHFPPSYF